MGLGDTLTRRSRWRLPALGILLGVPLLLSLLWGSSAIAESAYTDLYFADVARLRDLVDPARFPGQPHPDSPLWSLLLSAVRAAGVPVPLVALVLGGLAWAVTGAAMVSIGDWEGLPAGRIVAIGLLACSPAVVAPSVLGTVGPLLTGLVGVMVWATARRRWFWQTIAGVLLLGFRVDALSLVVTGLCLASRLRVRSRLTWFDRCSLAVPLAGWLIASLTGIVLSPSVAGAVHSWLGFLSGLGAASPLVWLAMPLATVGVLRLARRARGGRRLASVLVAAALSYAAAWQALVYCAAAWAVCTGLAHSIRRISGYRLLNLDRTVSRRALVVAAVLPLVVAQAVALRAAWYSAPRIHNRLLQDAATWIRDRSVADARVLGSAQVGFLSGRRVLPYGSDATSAGSLDEMMATLRGVTPDACVSHRSLAWDALERTGWFQNTYYAAAAFRSDYDSASPVIVWLRWPTHTDLGLDESLSVRLPDGSSWVGHTFTPYRVHGGDVVSVTLYTFTPTSMAPRFAAPTSSPEVYLQPPADEDPIAETDEIALTRLVDAEPAVGTVVQQTFRVAVPADLAMGAYYLSASMVKTSTGSKAQLYRDETPFPIDRVTLGYVVVPWEGDLGSVTPVSAVLAAEAGGSGRFALSGYKVGGEAIPGGATAVTLYWEAQDDMASVTGVYFSFVHLLNEAGELVAQHDGPPVAGRYPLAAWAPGETIPDTHQLFLGEGLPAGEYRLQAGVYTWPTFERLMAWDAEGNELVDRVIPLGPVQIR